MTSTIEPTTEPVPAIGGVPPEVLAERYGTPLYAYDADAIRAAYARIEAAVPYRPHRIHYACVANANLALMRLIGSLGGGIHANTWGDALMALRAGFCADDIMYSGGQLGPEDMFNLFSHGIAANVSSLSQLRELLRRPPRVRGTDGQAGRHPSPRRAATTSRRREAVQQDGCQDQRDRRGVGDRRQREHRDRRRSLL